MLPIKGACHVLSSEEYATLMFNIWSACFGQLQVLPILIAGVVKMNTLLCSFTRFIVIESLPIWRGYRVPLRWVMVKLVFRVIRIPTGREDNHMGVYGLKSVVLKAFSSSNSQHG